MVISSGEVDGEPLPWPRLITISGVADPVEVLAEDEALVLEAPPRLMVMSSGEADEELLAWPRLITISGVVEPLEELALDALPRLMTISSPPEPVAVDGGTLIGGTTGVGPTACPRGPWPPKVAARVAKADWASARSPDCSA